MSILKDGRHEVMRDNGRARADAEIDRLTHIDLTTHNGTQGRAYGGDPDLVHIPDGHRAEAGKITADHLSDTMRILASAAGQTGAWNKPLCPGCYMIAIFDAAVSMAREHGQDVKELGHSMTGLFDRLAREGEYRVTEEMIVRP